jgi:competence protein ComEA
MLKLSRLPLSLLALTIAGPVMAQPATTAAPGTSSPSTVAPAVPSTPKGLDTPNTTAVPQPDMVDINSATAAELKMLPSVSDSDASKIIQGRPYADKSQLISKKAVSESTYAKIKDHLIAKQSKS